MQPVDHAMSFGTAGTQSSPAARFVPRLLMTGASGFIGSRVALYAREQGYDVIATGLSRNSAERARIDELRELGIQVHECDLHDLAALERLLENCSAVIHLAAAQHEANMPESYFLEVNVSLTRQLLEACIRCGVQRFVYGSSIGVYGRAAGEEALSEITPLDPQNAYAKSKTAAEKAVREFDDRIQTVIIRISETYGPGDYRLLKLFKAIARGVFVNLGGGRNKHQPIYVQDLADGLLLAARHPAASGQTFVLAGREVLTTTDMASAIAGAIGVPGRTARLPLWPLQAAAVVMENLFRPLGMQPPLHRRRLTSL